MRRIVQGGRKVVGPEDRGAGLWRGAIFRGLDFGKAMSSVLLLILADNYNLTTNDPTTESQSEQRLR